MIDVQILHCGERPIDALKEVFSDNEFSFSKVWAVCEKNELPQDVSTADVWLLSGSPCGAYEKREWIIRLIAFIQEAYEAGVPMVGVCFGHQVIAHALGGSVVKFPGGWNLGIDTYVFYDGSPIHMFAYHQDQVVQKPPGANVQVVAHSPFTKYAGLKYGDIALTFQFHPDIFDDAMKCIFESGSLPEYAVNRAKETLWHPASQHRVIKYIKSFIKGSHQIRSRGYLVNLCTCF